MTGQLTKHLIRELLADRFTNNIIFIIPSLKGLETRNFLPEEQLGSGQLLR